MGIKPRTRSAECLRMPGESRTRSESIKGVLMLGAVVSARRLRDRGAISREALEARLSAEALELIDQKVEPTRWYPVGPFCELIELDWDVVGRRDPAYLERQGEVAAERLFDRGTYQQLDFAQRSGKVETRDGLIRQSRLITTITGALYDFLTFEVDLGPNALEVVFGRAEHFGDCLIHTTVGFMNQINRRQGSKRRWTGRRESRDRVLFSMELPSRLT